MSGKNLTPHGKETSKNPQSASKYRTPSNLNSTLLERRDTTARFSKGRTASRSTLSASYSHLDVTGIGSVSRAPALKANLTTTPSTSHVDYELECDLVYCDYLQALLKKEILTKTVEQHEKEMNDQIALERDTLFKIRLKNKEAKEELAEMEQLEMINALIGTLKNNFERFHQLSENINLQKILEQLLCLFNWFCSRVSVKNVKSLETEEDFSKLESVLKECVTVFQRLNLQERNQKEVDSLAEVMRKYQEQVQQVTEKQNFINTAQGNEVLKLFKSLSQMYAKREHYQSQD